MNKVKGAFDKVVEWDKKLIKKCQDKWNLTDYQVVCISFAKGFIIGAILLYEICLNNMGINPFEWFQSEKMVDGFELGSYCRDQSMNPWT